MKKIKVVLSDLHLAGGLFLEDGSPNYLENFKFDRELVSLIYYFSNNYDQVEFILNGDILDFLNVEGEIKNNGISEVESFKKLKIILRGHPEVFDALRKNIINKKIKITYIIGNHDADFYFKNLQKYFKLFLTGESDSKAIKFIEKEFYEVEGGIQIHHGHQFEAMHSFNVDKPIFKKDGVRYLKLPWGSLFFIKVVNKFKREFDYVDKILPHSLFLFVSFFNNPVFAVKFAFTTAWYFLKTRMISVFNKQNPFRHFFKIVPEEFKLLEDGEGAGKKILKDKTVYAAILGHTHYPKMVKYPSGQIYLNTGTWIRMIHLDLKYFGQNMHLPFCLIEYKDGLEKPMIRLVEWKYQEGPFRDLVF